MTDLSSSVIMPREDFIELSTVAFDNSHVPTAGERAGTVLQTFGIFAGMAAAVAGTTWVCTKAVDWLEERRLKRKLADAQFDIDNGR